MVRVIKRIIIELDVTRNLFYIARRQCVGAKKKKETKMKTASRVEKRTYVPNRFAG